MCVAKLGKVVKTGEKRALVDFDGLKMEVRSGLVDIKPGDNVLVHAGIIIQTVKDEEAREMKELEELMSGGVKTEEDGAD